MPRRPRSRAAGLEDGTCGRAARRARAAPRAAARSARLTVPVASTTAPASIEVTRPIGTKIRRRAASSTTRPSTAARRCRPAARRRRRGPGPPGRRWGRRRRVRRGARRTPGSPVTAWRLPRRRGGPMRCWTTRSWTCSPTRRSPGNPLAVVFDADDLTPDLQALASSSTCPRRCSSCPPTEPGPTTGADLHPGRRAAVRRASERRGGAHARRRRRLRAGRCGRSAGPASCRSRSRRRRHAHRRPAHVQDRPDLKPLAEASGPAGRRRGPPAHGTGCGLASRPLRPPRGVDEAGPDPRPSARPASARASPSRVGRVNPPPRPRVRPDWASARTRPQARPPSGRGLVVATGLLSARGDGVLHRPAGGADGPPVGALSARSRPSGGTGDLGDGAGRCRARWPPGASGYILALSSALGWALQRPGGRDVAPDGGRGGRRLHVRPVRRLVGAPSLAIAFWRNAPGAASLLPVLLARGRRGLAAFDRPTGAPAAVAGLFLAIHFCAWVPSLSITTVPASTAPVTTTRSSPPSPRGHRRRPVAARGVAGGWSSPSSGRRWSPAPTSTSPCGRSPVTDWPCSVRSPPRIRAVGGTGPGAAARRPTPSPVTPSARWACPSAAWSRASRWPGYSTRAWLLIAAMTGCARCSGTPCSTWCSPRSAPTLVSLAILLEVPGRADRRTSGCGQ